MPAPVTSDEFLQLLRKSGLFNAARFGTHFASEEDLPRDPQKCAAAFVSAGMLTSYQAKLLLSGRYRGFVLGPYTLLQPIGKGGMGAVYLADHTALSRQVAIKVLPTDKARDKLSLERFQREARAVAALDHPNIVKVFDICHAGGVHFLVLEYVDGIDLQSLIDNTGPLPCDQAARYIAQAAAGLSHAHQRGFVHRDVKPSNLMVTREGQIKILDLGLARSYLDRRDNLTEQIGENSDIAGTIDFCSPEHAVGQPVDARSDIYSLGATFCTLVTGKPPYSGTTAQKLLQHQMKAPPNLSLELKGSVPPDLSMIVMKMMAKRKEDRFATADDLHTALTNWIPSTDSHPKAAASLAQTPPPVSKKRLRAPFPYRNGAIAVGIALTVMVGAAVYSLMIPSNTKTNATASVAPISTAKEIPPPVVDKTPAVQAPAPANPVTPAPHTETPTNPPAKKTLAKITQHIMFQASSLNRFAEEFAGGTNTHSQQKELLTAPWGAGVWKTGSRGHIEVGDFEGIPAIILKNLEGTAAVQLYTLDPLFMQPENARAVVRVEYRTSGKAAGNLQVRTAKSGSAASRRVILPNTNKLWDSVELELPPGEARPAFICIQNTGPNNDALAVRSIQAEVMESEGNSGKIDQ